MPSHDPYTFVDFIDDLCREDPEKEEKRRARRFWRYIFKLKMKRKFRELVKRITKCT